MAMTANEDFCESYVNNNNDIDYGYEWLEGLERVRLDNGVESIGQKIMQFLVIDQKSWQIWEEEGKWILKTNKSFESKPLTKEYGMAFSIILVKGMADMTALVSVSVCK
jgi:hypothetical protein